MELQYKLIHKTADDLEAVQYIERRRPSRAAIINQGDTSYVNTVHSSDWDAKLFVCVIKKLFGGTSTEENRNSSDESCWYWIKRTELKTWSFIEFRRQQMTRLRTGSRKFWVREIWCNSTNQVFIIKLRTCEPSFEKRTTATYKRGVSKYLHLLRQISWKTYLTISFSMSQIDIIALQTVKLFALMWKVANSSEQFVMLIDVCPVFGFYFYITVCSHIQYYRNFP